MPRRRDIDHFLLHFRIERDDVTADVDVRRRSEIIIAAFEAAATNSQTPLAFLITRMAGIIGPDKSDADVIRELAQALKLIDADNRPTELLGFVEGAV